MYKATLRDIEQKGLGADEAHTALLREVSDEHPAGLEGTAFFRSPKSSQKK